MDGIFQDCKNLREINLSSVKIIGEEAFLNCINLKSIKALERKNRIIVLEFKFAKNKSEVEKKMSEGQTQISDREYAKSYGADKNFETLNSVFVANDEERCIEIG